MKDSTKEAKERCSRPETLLLCQCGCMPVMSKQVVKSTKRICWHTVSVQSVSLWHSNSFKALFHSLPYTHTHMLVITQSKFPGLQYIWQHFMLDLGIRARDFQCKLSAYLEALCRSESHSECKPLALGDSSLSLPVSCSLVLTIPSSLPHTHSYTIKLSISLFLFSLIPSLYLSWAMLI